MRAGNQQANSSPESGAPGPFPRLCRSWVVFPRMNWSPWAFAAEGPLQRSVTIPQPPTFRTRRGKLVWMPIPAPTSPQRQLLKSKPNETAKSHSGRNRILPKRDIQYPSLVPWVTPWFSSAMSGVPGLGGAAICALGGIHEDWFRLGANGGQLWCGR